MVDWTDCILHYNKGCRLNCVPRVSLQGWTSQVGVSGLCINRKGRIESSNGKPPAGFFMQNDSLLPSRPADHRRPLVALPCPQDCNSLASALQVQRESR